MIDEGDEMNHLHAVSPVNAYAAKNSSNDNGNSAVSDGRSFQVPTGPAILQLNVEGLTKAKCEVIEQIAIKHNVKVVLLQETHAADDSGTRL